MDPIKSIERALRNKLNVTAGPALHDRVLARIRQAEAQSKESLPARNGPVTRRTIMRSPSMKWAVAAAAVVAVGTGLIGIWHEGGPTAYAFAQTVEAMQGKRSFHIQTYFQQRCKDEFWAEFDKQGNLVRFRQEEDGGPKGPLITIWENGILNRYYPDPGLHQWSRLKNETGLEGLEEFDPETIVQEINALVEAGKAVVETDELSRYAKLVTLRVTRENKNLKQVLVVNPVTKFVVRVDDYWGVGKGDAIHKGIEVLEYNEAMDPKLFEPDFPEDAVLMDQVTQEVGMAQGDLTVKEVAVEVVRQALDAWAQGDHTKAGNLFGGVPPQWFTKFEDRRPVRILSIGTAEPLQEDDRPPYVVRCQYETERNGRKRTVTLGLVVPDVDGQPGRWHVSVFFRDVDGSANATPLDVGSADIGLVQGQLSDEEAATEVVRRFFESIQAGDYDAARRLVPPDGDVDVEECLGTAEFLRIASIGEALLIPSRGEKVVGVVCTIECEEDGQKNLKTLRATIVQRSDRWVFQDLSD